jgi:hypothetical protein
MTGGPSESTTAVEPTPEAAPAPERGFRVMQVVLATIAGLLVVAALALLLYYRSGRERRHYEALVSETLDKLVTAQEGFFYDSAHYARSLPSLRTFQPPPGVRVSVAVADTAHSWSGTATHDALSGGQCVVWVGRAPTTLPEAARAPENETKPLCFDVAPGAR